MLYAKVAIGLPVEGPFDYFIPESLHKNIGLGFRVWVDFRNKRMVGYVVAITSETKIRNLKEISGVIDKVPILTDSMLSLTKQISKYYCCSWGEAIETALPEALRKGRKIPNNIEEFEHKIKRDNQSVLLIHDLDKKSRYDIYIEHIKENQRLEKSAIILSPNINSALKIKEKLEPEFNLSPVLLYRKKTKELEGWLKIKSAKTQIVIGLRSAIFAPVRDLGLIIIDEEQDAAYKQEQVPHYNARDVALMRIKIEKAKLVMASSCPSLESFYQVTKNKFEYKFFQDKSDFSEIKIIDLNLRQKILSKSFQGLSKYLQDSIYQSLNANEKILLFLDRKGFATLAICKNCASVLKCPRCNINLTFYFKDKILNCHYCNFKMPVPQVCPKCNSGYIKFSGRGTEKLESDLSRMYPAAKIKRQDYKDLIEEDNIDILLSTRLVIKRAEFNFDLVGVLSIDNSLNRIDFRAAEKSFSLLIGLLNLARKKILIQTRFPNHHCFKALVNRDIRFFYQEELSQRRELQFPPFKHFCIIKLRASSEEKVKKISYKLFHSLNKRNRNKDIKVISVNPGVPAKLRNKFYWCILLSSGNVERLNKFIKLNLKKFPHSDIIITVDPDPL